MKKSILFLYLCLLFIGSSCIKQLDKDFKGDTIVEFDATVLNSVTTPYNYFVATRVPSDGVPVTTSNPSITRSLTTPVRLRVNLIGPQRSADEVISYKVLTDITPVLPNMLAVAGTHFTTGSSFTIPADSSFGYVTINILNPGTSSTNPREVHLELLGNENVKPSQNYKRAAIRIAQN